MRSARSYVGTIPDRVYAFNAILEERDADEVFADRLERSHTAGRLYALCGLYLEDRRTFDQVIGPYIDIQDEVATFMGCIISGQEVSSIALDIRNGTWPKAFRDAL